MLKNVTIWNITIGSILNSNRENKIIILKNHIEKIKTFSNFSFYFSEGNKIIIKESFYSDINCFDAFMNFDKNNFLMFAKNNFQLISASNIVSDIPTQLKGIIFFNSSNSCISMIRNFPRFIILIILGLYLIILIWQFLNILYFTIQLL